MAVDTLCEMKLSNEFEVVVESRMENVADGSCVNSEHT